MAVLRHLDGSAVRETEQIAATLAPLGVRLAVWPVEAGESGSLLDKPALSGEEQEQLLAALDPTFQQLRKESGYQARDLVVLHPETPKLDQSLDKFHRIHTHPDDEVRYIVDGEGVFGFVLPDGEQVEVEVKAGDFVNVPKGVEHWFRLTDRKRIKAVRYFTDTAGWVPQYTGRSIAFG